MRGGFPGGGQAGLLQPVPKRYNIILYMTSKQWQRYTPRTAFSFFKERNCPGWDLNPQHSAFYMYIYMYILMWRIIDIVLGGLLSTMWTGALLRSYKLSRVMIVHVPLAASGCWFLIPLSADRSLRVHAVRYTALAMYIYHA